MINKNDNNNTPILTFDNEYIKSKIYTIRGQQVMLDYDLAAIYGYSTKAFNQQVQRNIEKFEGEDFMFQLTINEWTYIQNNFINEKMNNNLRSQNVTSSMGTNNQILRPKKLIGLVNEHIQSQNVTAGFGTSDQILRSKNLTSSWGGNRYLPFAFSESGIYMLMTVLRGDLAIKQSRMLIRLFKSMKDYIVNNKSLLTHDEALKISLKNMEDINENKKEIKEIRSTMASKNDIKDVENRLNILSDNFIHNDNIKSFIIESNTKFEVDEYYSNLFKKVNKTLIIIDNYMSIKTLSLLEHLKDNINIKLITDFKLKSRDKFTKHEYLDFIKEHPNIKVKLYDSKSKVHDRFIIIDYKTNKQRILTSGASIKDTGNKLSVIVELNDIKLSKELIDLIENNEEYEW